jgi:hypothetical protein
MFFHIMDLHLFIFLQSADTVVGVLPRVFPVSITPMSKQKESLILLNCVCVEIDKYNRVS